MDVYRSKMETDPPMDKIPGNHSLPPGKGVKPEEAQGTRTPFSGAVLIHMFCQPQGARWMEWNPAYIKTSSEDVSSSFY